jgi:hypothetical protein
MPPPLYPYQTDPTRPAVLIGAVFLSLAVIAAVTPASVGGLFAVVFVACAGGPLTWAALQWLRNGRGIRLYDDHVLIQRSISGRFQAVKYAALRGYGLTKRGGLIVVYSEASPDPEAPPKRGLILTARLAAPAHVLADLHARRQTAAPHPDPLPPGGAEQLAARRRLRDALLILIVLLATPLWGLILLRIIAGFRA